MNTNNLFPNIVKVNGESSGEIVEEMDHGLFPSFLSTNNNNNNTTTSSDFNSNSNHENLHSNLHSKQNHGEKEGVRFPEIPNFIEAIFTLLVCGFLLAAILIIIKKAKIWCASRNHRGGGDEENCPTELSTSSCSNNKPSNGSNLNSNSGVGVGTGEFNSQDSTLSDKKIPQNKDHKGQTPDSNPNTKDTSKLGVIENDESSQGKSEDSKSYSRQSSNQSRDSRNSSKRSSQKPHGPGKSPNRVIFERRSSGPFGDECLEYIGETYKKLPEQKHYEEKESRTKRMSTRRMTKKSTDPQQKRRNGDCEGDKPGGGESRSSSRLDEGKDSNPGSPTPSS